MLTCSIYPIPMSEMLLQRGIFGLSCIIGILAIFAPSGLGVREGIPRAGIGGLLCRGVCGAYLYRVPLWMTVSELALIGIAFVVNQVMGRRKK